MSTSTLKVESGIQLLARLTKKPTIQNFYPPLFQSDPKPREVIEITFSEDAPQCLLNDIICTNLLPANFGGAEMGLLMFNCSGNFSYVSLMSRVRTKIMANTTFTGDKIDDIIEGLFNNLFVVEIHDATQYYTTLYNLENVLTAHPNISMIIFDTITAFYWSEQGYKIQKMDTYLKRVLSKIQHVTREHNVIVLYTKPEYFNSHKDVSDNQEPCCEFPCLEGVNYKIGVSYDKDNNYIAKIKSYNIQLEKGFCVTDDEIRWF
ncbi:DNA repair protein XRCC2-like [Ostrinia nubilalis]|uniref:DNA repair protein XRCC2-like n=1 Tax=Ostrinia nubilalis TaxID=29057 RepID=UPI0030826246